MPDHNLQQLVAELNSLIKELRYEEALDKFYDENIVTCENENQPLTGLAAYRAKAKVFLKNISNYSAELKSTVISDNMSVNEWHYTFDHKMGGRWDCTQVSVQRWKDGKIIHERHHYKTPESSI